MKQTFILGIETNHKNFNDWITEHDKSLCHSLMNNQELKKCKTIIELPCLGDAIYRIDLDEIEKDDFEIESYVIECISILMKEFSFIMIVLEDLFVTLKS